MSSGAPLVWYLLIGALLIGAGVVLVVLAFYYSRRK